MAEAFNIGRGEGFEQAELGGGSQLAVQTAVVDDVARLVEIDVGVLPQLAVGGLVQVQLAYGGRAHAEVGEGFGGETVDFLELCHGIEAAEPLAAPHQCACVAAAYARHLLQLCGVGGVQGDVFAGAQLDGILGGVARNVC